MMLAKLLALWFVVILVIPANSYSETVNKKSTNTQAKSLAAAVIKPLVIPAKISDLSGGVLAQIIPEKEKFKKGIFWKIERPGYKPSFLFGTMHSPHPDVIALTKVISNAFSGATVLCTEIKMDFAAMGAMQKAMTYPKGQSLRQAIGDDLFKQVVKRVKSLGIDAVRADRLKAWAVNMLLQYPKPNGQLILDMKLMVDASNQKKQLCGLEKIDEQVKELVAGMAKNQVQSLRLTLQHYDKIGVMLNKMRVAYIAGNLEVLSGAVLRPTIPFDKKDTELMLFHLAVRRNILMLNRMQPYLKKGNTFFAVGALHLVGKGGLLRLLESQGYKLTRLY